MVERMDDQAEYSFSQPKQGKSRCSAQKKNFHALAVLIAFTGIIFTGIILAIAFQAAAKAFKAHRAEEVSKTVIETMTKLPAKTVYCFYNRLKSLRMCLQKA